MSLISDAKRRSEAFKAIAGYFGENGVTSEEGTRFFKEHPGGFGSPQEALAPDGVVRQFVNKIQAINAIGGLTQAEKFKMVDKYKTADDISSLVGRASEYLGRAPKEGELAGILRSKDFINDPGIYASKLTGIAQREGAIADIQDLTGNSFDQTTIDKYAKMSDAEFKSAYRKDTTNFTPGEKWTAPVADLIKNTLGREATQEELNHFGKSLASGAFDTQQLTDVFKSSSEYQDKQAETARTQIGAQQSGINQQFLAQALPQIQGQFAAQGRGNTSAMTAQGAQVAQNLGMASQQFLLGVGAQDIGQNRQNQYQQYLASQANGIQNQAAFQQYAQYAQQQAAQQRQAGLGMSYGLQQQNWQRQNSLQDFQMQQSAYNDYLRQNQNQAFQNNLFQLGGAAIGAFGATNGFGAFGKK